MSDHENREILLKAEHLCKSFYYPAPVEILSEVSLTVHRGDTVAIMGRSGQGKSTLLQILGTLEDPCKGRLEIAGQLVHSFSKSRIRNRHIAFVFQSFHLLEDYTALENVLMPARISRESVGKGSKKYRDGLDLLEQVGLKDRAYFHTKLLSGGEKQRVAIARALCNDPDIIFADEPSGNLDKQTSHDIHSLLLGYAHRSGKSVVIVTHDQHLAGMCSRRFILGNGQLSSW